MDANAAYLFAMTIATLAFGAAAAQQDVREGKIGNRLVFSGIAFAALANVAVAFYDYAFFQSFAVNSILALLAGYALWELKVWTAGDAKLFAMFAALVPLQYYSKEYFPLFPSFILLVNMALPAAAFLLFEAWAKTTSEEKMEVAGQAAKPESTAATVLFLFWFPWALKWGGAMLGYEIGTVYGLAATLAALYAATLLVGAGGILKVSLAGAAARVATLLFSSDPVANAWQAAFLLGISSAFVFVFSFCLGLAQYWFGSSVRIRDLKPGMVLETGGLETAKKRDAGEKAGKFLSRFGGRPLSEDDVAEIKRALQNKVLKKDHLPVRQFVSFAPFMLAGAVLTILINRSVISFLAELVKLV